MTRTGRIAAALIALACIAGGARTARGAAATLDPFRGVGPRGDKAERALDPFRIAQALANPAAADEAPKPKTVAKPAPAPTPTSASASAKSCQRDEDCPDGNIC